MSQRTPISSSCRAPPVRDAHRRPGILEEDWALRGHQRRNYMPMLEVSTAACDEGVAFRITMTLTPPMAACCATSS